MSAVHMQKHIVGMVAKMNIPQVLNETCNHPRNEWMETLNHL
jgi:hypothetical protein